MRYAENYSHPSREDKDVARVEHPYWRIFWLETKVGCKLWEWRYFPRSAARWTLDWVEVVFLG